MLLGDTGTTNRWWTTTWLCFWNCTTRGGTCVRISPIHARILSHGTSSYSISIHERPERPYLPRETRAARVSVLYENRRLQVWNHLQIPSPERQSYSLTNLRFKPYWSPFATGKSSHNCCIALELSSSNSIGALVRNWSLSTLHRLFGLQFHFITLHYISDQLWCMLGGNVCS